MDPDQWVVNEGISLFGPRGREREFFNDKLLVFIGNLLLGRRERTVSPSGMPTPHTTYAFLLSCTSGGAGTHRADRHRRRCVVGRHLDPPPQHSLLYGGGVEGQGLVTLFPSRLSLSPEPRSDPTPSSLSLEILHPTLHTLHTLHTHHYAHYTLDTP